MTSGPGGRSSVDRPAVALPEQGELFPDPLLGAGFDGLPDQLVGFRGPTACQVVGITYRQLDYWARTGLVVPSIRGAAGSGIAAAVLVQGRARPQGRQAAARRRGLAAEHPGGGRAPAPPRHPGPRRDHAVQRRHHGLRVRLARGGRRPAAGRPGRVRHRRQRARCGRSAARSRTSRWSAPTAAPSTTPRRTSCPAAARAGVSQEAGRDGRLFARKQRIIDARRLAGMERKPRSLREWSEAASPVRRGRDRSDVGPGLDGERSPTRAGESGHGRAPKEQILPGTSQAPGPRGRDASGKRGSTAPPSADGESRSVLAGESLRCPGRRAETEGEGDVARRAPALPGGPACRPRGPPVTSNVPLAESASGGVPFADRHIGPRPDELAPCWRAIGVASLDELADRGAARSIRDTDAGRRRRCRPRPPRPRCSPSCARSPPATPSPCR